MVVRKLGPLEIERARLRVSREPQVTVEVVWTPTAERLAEQRRHKHDLMAGGPYEVSLPTGESWSLMPESWQETPEGEVTVRLRSIHPPAHGPDGSPFSLALESGASESEQTQVADAFRSIGFESGDISLYERRGLGDNPWAIIASVSLGIFLKSFLEQAGHNAADGLREFVRRVFEAREASPKPKGELVLIDSDSGIRVIIPTELPIEACQELLALDLSELGNHYDALVYNAQTGKWELY